MPQQHVLVIGGGLGGLAPALRLAAQGWSVTICERGATVGGNESASYRVGRVEQRTV